MKLNFIKLSTAENTTVIIIDPVPSSSRGEVAGKIMGETHLSAEQVGFLSTAGDRGGSPKLEMAGNEFCGNGLLAAGAAAIFHKLVTPPEFTLEISGAEGSFQCQGEEAGPGRYLVKASVPSSFSCREISMKSGGKKLRGQLMELAGITHLLVESNPHLPEEVLMDLNSTLIGEIKREAVGVVSWYQDESGASIKPCIHVGKIGTTIFERGCGSGTLALGLYLASQQEENLLLEVEQPGGFIEVGVEGGKEEDYFKIEEAFLRAKVEVTCRGEVIL